MFTCSANQTTISDECSTNLFVSKNTATVEETLLVKTKGCGVTPESFPEPATVLEQVSSFLYLNIY